MIGGEIKRSGRKNKEMMKEPKKYQPSLSVVNYSQPLFKMEVKVHIKLHQVGINALKLNQ